MKVAFLNFRPAQASQAHHRRRTHRDVLLSPTNQPEQDVTAVPTALTYDST
jgi:hypothetical protein